MVTVCIVGGLARQKQERLLNRNPQVVVATPGRLWEFVAEGHPWLSSLHMSLTHLVLDEADRMADPGSFADLDQLFQRIFHPIQEASSSLTKTKGRELSFQILLFSATLNIGDRGRDDKWARRAGGRDTRQFSKKASPWVHGWKQGSFPNYPGVDSLLTLLGNKGLVMQKRPAVVVIDAGEAKEQHGDQETDSDTTTAVKSSSDVNKVALPDTLQLYQVPGACVYWCKYVLWVA